MVQSAQARREDPLTSSVNATDRLRKVIFEIYHGGSIETRKAVDDAFAKIDGKGAKKDRANG